MDLNLEREGTALGSLFQQIINDMKNSSPLWEDFVAKASKLHACLRAAIQAIGAYLDAFQKIADAATNSRGASKEIGTALTRVCLRHKAVETRLKTFTTAIMDCLVQPLQEKLEEWKRTVSIIDKDHAKEYKRCRTELKKRSSDTLRLQKKARKGQSETIQSLMDSHMQDVTLRRAELEDVEKKSLRSAMIEERMRYCCFVNFLQPVVKEECEFMSELGHLQEAMQSIALVTKEPNVLPQASEEIIHDVKATITLYPESPGGGSGSAGACSNSLGSRKSSVCSISSMNSSGSSNSPGHHHYPRSLSQLIAPSIRLKPGESSDSGFCSTPALTTQASTATAQTSSISTWPPHSQDPAGLPPTADRPHTISTAYEKGHQRPPLTVYTFENPETIPEGTANTNIINEAVQNAQKSPASALNRPPLPVRCSSLERPIAAKTNGGLVQRQCPSPIPAHVANEHQQLQQQQQQKYYMQQQQMQSPPTYVNMSELANMQALKNTNQQQQQQQDRQQQQMQAQHSIDSISSQISNDSMNLHSQTQQNPQPNSNTNLSQQRSLSISSSSASSSNIASLHSQPSIDSAVHTPLVGQTPTPSSGSSTPQNHYSPLINNSDGTPSNASIASGALYTYSSTPPPGQSVASSSEQALKIIEQNRNKVKADFNLDEGIPPTSAETDSPTIVENDERSRASVLQKASMFEKQAAACSPASATNTRSSHSYVQRTEEERQQVPADQTDTSFEDSMQELNNLLGELDLFQREIDASQQRIGNNDNNGETTSTTITTPTTSRKPKEESTGNCIEMCERQKLVQEMFDDACSLTSYTSINNNNNHNESEHDSKFVDSTSELNRFMNQSDNLSVGAGYENPTFAHFAVNATPTHDTSSYISANSGDNGSNVVVIYDHQIPMTPDMDYVKQNSEIIALRTNDPQQQSQLLPHETRELQQLTTNAYQVASTYNDDNDGANKPNTANLATVKQRLSSFRATSEQQLQLLGLKQQQQQQHQQQQHEKGEGSTRIARRSSINTAKPPPPVRRSSSVTPSHNSRTTSPHQSLVTNTTPPPPPPPMQQQYVKKLPLQHNNKIYAAAATTTVTPPTNHTTIAENLPPPPAYLLEDSHSRQVPISTMAPVNYLPNSTMKVVETVKTLSALRHQPASPAMFRRQPPQQQQAVQQSPEQQASLQSFRNATSNTGAGGNGGGGIYAQPKLVNSMSSFRSASPSPSNASTPANGHLHPQPKANPNLIAQLNARLNSKQQQQQNEGIYNATNYQGGEKQEPIYMRANYGQQPQQQPQTQQQHHHHHQKQPQAPQLQQHQKQQPAQLQQQTKQQQIEAGSIRAKTKAEFLENLNAKLAKQGMSGRAYAVRNLINSKALPDPRICHESLMDQIKRGATLKRNQKINDRSAPKIH